MNSVFRFVENNIIIMISKIIKTVTIIILAVMPYSTVLSNFSPYETSHSFQDFLIASAVFALISLLLGFVIAGKHLLSKKGIFFFVLGMIIAPPLMLGIPETSPKLLERSTEEHFRYGLLILATFIFAIGFITVLKNRWSDISSLNKLIVIPFAASVILMLWDSYSSFNFSSELKNWIAEGNKAEAFFPSYDFHELYRTLGRSLLYIIIPWLCYILVSKQQIKKWQFILLSIFCALGILFFFLFNFVNVQFYFPFMIPAIALAPAYWLGLILISKNQNYYID